MEPKMLHSDLLPRMPAHTDQHAVEFLQPNFGVQSSERRRRTRLRVHWLLRLHKANATEAVETVTHDLSSDGFYCLAKTSFVPGESLTCTLGVPTRHPNGAARLVSVECRARIVRVEAAPGGLFGVACRIEEYRLLYPAG